MPSQIPNPKSEPRLRRSVFSRQYLVDFDPVTIKSNVRMSGVFLQEGEQVGLIDPEKMKTVFADTGYYIALVNSEDEYHLRAREYTASFRGSFLTTSWVLLELANHLAKELNRALFLSLFDDLRKNQRVRILPPAQAEFDRGIELYRHRPDKDWSLTDCVSFVVMRDHGINEALRTGKLCRAAEVNSPLWSRVLCRD